MCRRVDSLRPLRFGVSALLSVVGVSVGLYTLPRSTKVDLALLYSRADYVSLFASHYTHFSLDHLLTNLIVLMLLEPLALGLALSADDDWLFDVATATYLLVFPPILSGLNLLVVRSRPGIGFGFSGINMAFLGLLAVALFRYLGAVDDRVRPDDALALFFVGSGIAAGLAVPLRWISLPVVAVSTAAVAAYLYGIHRRVDGLANLGQRVHADGHSALVAAALIVYPGVAVAGFAPSGDAGGTVVNFYTHFLGFGLGFGAAYLTPRSEGLLDGFRSRLGR
jgi:hypothetical protein